MSISWIVFETLSPIALFDRVIGWIGSQGARRASIMRIRWIMFESSWDGFREHRAMKLSLRSLGL